MGRFHLPLARILFGVIGVVALGLVARIFLVEDPDGGRPTAEVPIRAAEDPNPLATALSETPATITVGPEIPANQIGGPTIITLDGLEGGSTVLEGDTDAPAQASLDASLAEETQYGAIPKMGPGGETPFATYAHKTATANPLTGPRIAIVITGLGLNEAGSLEVIDKLPDPVTLAFAPYGKTLERTVAAARADGHEILLEVPLEPFDYPDNDPGPQTLLTGEPARANLDKLFWLMARFGGYVGMINHMGARFTSSGADFSPFMEELGSRGLGYLDDGSSNRSLAPQLARTNKVPFGRADIVLDTNPAEAPILAALGRLEAQATETGAAIGIASALPISITTLAQWSETALERGFVLVPVSALMN